MINKIFNWTAGSFFRTLGRFIFYGIIVFLLSLLFFVNSSVKANTISNLRLWEGSSAYDWTSGNVGYYLSSNSFRAIEITTNVMDLSTSNEYQYGFIAYLSYDNVYQSYYSGQASWVYEDHPAFPNLQQIDTGVEQYFYNSSTVSGTIKYFTFNIDYDCGSGVTNCYGHGTIHFYGTTSDYQLLNYGLSTEPIIVDTTSGSIINQNNTIISQNDVLIQNQQETNDKLDQTNEQLGEMNDYIQDDTPASTDDIDMDSLGTVSGLLPEGPVDSLLNIPFTFLSVLTSSMGGVCVPITGTFVFDSTLSIPCFDSFYDEVPDYLMNFINLIPAGFILIMYFKHLYKKVERAVSLQTTTDDEWGVI